MKSGGRGAFRGGIRGGGGRSGSACHQAVGETIEVC
jgi:hypothetical protein